MPQHNTGKSYRSDKHDKMKHSSKNHLLGKNKGGKAQTGGWSDYHEDVKKYEGKSPRDLAISPTYEEEVYEEDFQLDKRDPAYHQPAQDEEKETEEHEKEVLPAVYRLQLWNIPRKGHQKVIDLISKQAGFKCCLSHDRTPITEDTKIEKLFKNYLFADFETLDHAADGLKFNNTWIGKKYIGVRYSQVLTDFLMQN